MPIQIPKININGELVDFKDIKKVVELYTKPLQDTINKIKNDKSDISQQRVACKQFEISSDKLRLGIQKFVPSSLNEKCVFDDKVPSPVGMQVTDFLSYMDVDVKPEYQSSNAPIIVKVDAIALPKKLQSIGFNSKRNSATSSSGIINTNLFKPGSFKILQQNNAIESQYSFNSPVDIVVGNGIGQFLEGHFLINDSNIPLSPGDTLQSICKKINQLQLGIKADVEINSNSKYRMILRSEKMGAVNAIRIDDPDMVLGVADQFVAMPEYMTVTIIQGDSIDRIASRINACEKNTKLHADVLPIGYGKYSLILRSVDPGIANAFQILDNTNNVFQDVFKDQPSQAATDADITVDGVKIKNTINKIQIYDGLEITLKAPSSKELSFDVQNNINAIFVAIAKFAEDYNAFRQSYEGDNQDHKKKNYLKDNMDIKSSFIRIDESLKAIEDLDIGISIGKLTVEKKDGDKDVKTEYNKMIHLDQNKLFESIQSDPAKVQKAFILLFDSSSKNFIKPIFTRPITINNKPLSAHKIDLDLDINLDLITVKSNSSTAFPSGYIVNSSDTDTKKFKPGTFFINGATVSINAGMNLQDIAFAINKASQMSRINAYVNLDSNNHEYISLTEYSGGYGASDDRMYFDKLNLYDPDNILRDVFSVSITTGDFDVQNLYQQTNEIDPSQSLIVNGLGATPNSNTLESLINAINDNTSHTGIIAKGVFNSQTNKYRIVFDTERLQNITIDNTGGCIASTINVPTSIPLYQQQKEFFDTSQAVISKVIIDDNVYHKSCLFSINGQEKTSGGSISVINNDNSKLKIANLEVWFVGGQSDNAHISISQGIANNILDELDNIFKYQPTYHRNGKIISTVFSEIDAQESKLTKTLSDKEDLLEKNKESIIKKFSSASSTVDQYNIYQEIVQNMFKNKDND